MQRGPAGCALIGDGELSLPAVPGEPAAEWGAHERAQAPQGIAELGGKFGSNFEGADTHQMLVVMLTGEMAFAFEMHLA